MKKTIFYFIISILIFNCKIIDTTNEEEINKIPNKKTEKTINQKNTKKEKFYTIKKGDTLWSIAKKIHKNPYLWYKIWVKNKTKIKNPNKIYPNSKIIVL